MSDSQEGESGDLVMEEEPASQLEESAEALNESEETNEENPNGNEATQVTSERITRSRDINRFPITRIRTIMKTDPDLTIASQDSVYLICRAAVSAERVRQIVAECRF